MRVTDEFPEASVLTAGGYISVPRAYPHSPYKLRFARLRSVRHALGLRRLTETPIPSRLGLDEDIELCFALRYCLPAKLAESRR